MEEIVQAAFFGFIFVVIMQAKHFQKYQKAIASLGSRGFNVEGYRAKFFNAGSGGCISKIKSVRKEFGNGLTEEELALLRRSELCYQANLIFVVPFVLWVLYVVFTGLQ